MVWSTRNSTGPIGVDIGGRYIKAVQLAGQGGKARVIAATAVPRKTGAAAVEREEIVKLGDILFRQGFIGSRVVVGAPAESLLVGSLALPPKGSGAPIDEIARMELARLHKQDPAAFELVHWELPAVTASASTHGKAGASAVMAAACLHQDANVLLDHFDAAALEVTAIDVPWMALARAAGRLAHTTDQDAPRRNAMTAILDLGWHSARVIALREGVIVFERILTEAGLKRLAATLREKLSLDEAAADLILCEVGCTAPSDQDAATDRRSTPEDDGFMEPRRLISAHFADVMEELKVSLTYALQQSRAESIDRLILAGGGAVPGLAKQWGQAMQIETVRAELNTLVNGPRMPGRYDRSPMLATATGLAMHQM